MTKKTIFWILTTVLLTTATVAPAQQPQKIPRIAYLSARDPASDSPRGQGIRLALRELGYIEDQNLAIEYRYANGKSDRFPELAAELVRLKVDIIVAAGGDALLRPVINATKTIPIIMTGGGADPVRAGFIKSLARPGGNVTGLTNLIEELSGKRLELLKEAVPSIDRVAVLDDSTASANGIDLTEILPAAARALGLTILPWKVRRARELDKVFAGITKQRPNGLIVSTGATLNTNRKPIVDFALKNRLPSIYGRTEYVAEGGLLYYGADLTDSYKRVAYYVDRILKGAKPADLPVEQPKKFEFVINLKTAKAIGVTIPPDVLARATKIIR